MELDIGIAIAVIIIWCRQGITKKEQLYWYGFAGGCVIMKIAGVVV